MNYLGQKLAAGECVDESWLRDGLESPVCWGRTLFVCGVIHTCTASVSVFELYQNFDSISDWLFRRRVAARKVSRLERSAKCGS